MKIFKETNSKLVYSYNPFIKIFKKNFSYKKTKFKNFHKIILKNAVMIICVNKKKILLTKEFRFGIKKYTWGLPGGFIEKKESPLQTAKRELLEETGFLSNKFKIIYKYVRNANYFCGKDYIFYTIKGYDYLHDIIKTNLGKLEPKLIKNINYNSKTALCNDMEFLLKRNDNIKLNNKKWFYTPEEYYIYFEANI